MPTLWLDTETFSECDLKSHGTHRYAEHESTEIMVVQWAVGDDEPQVQDMTAERYYNPELAQLLDDPNVVIVAHTSHFDRTLIRNAWGVDVPVERWRDTMVKALAHGLPGSLDKLGQILGLEEDQAKDKRGRELIQLFCKPRPKGHKLRRATRETHPKEWAEFLEYSRQDIIAMREVDRRLPGWNYRDSELALWHLDQRINDRGFAVDTGLAESAISAVATEQDRLKQNLSDATDGVLQSPSKRDELLAYILAEHGVDLPDMRADTLRRRMEDPELPEAVRLLLAIRLESTKTSTAKYKALLKSVSGDGRLRNTIQFCGAQRTGRWAGRIFQPQNMPRPDMDADDIAVGIDALKAGVVDVLTDEVMRLTSNAIRGCIVAPPGKKLCVSDLSNIEGRGLAYLAGEQWKLQAFRDFDAGKGEDLYKLAYARSFNADPKTVSKHQRQIGKVQELGLGYEGGVGAFLTFAAVYQMDLGQLADAVHETAPEEWLAAARSMLAWFKKNRMYRGYGLDERTWLACEALVLMWRDAHPNTVALWKATADAARKAIASPGQTFAAGPHLKLRVDGAWLRMRLPSGRYLCYLQPAVAEDGTISYMGVDQYTRQWKRIKTYGGKLAENATQGFARDVMAANMPAIEAEGYQIVLSVHDELPTETPDTDQYRAERLSALLATVPPWCPGMPLAAAGFEAYRYKKE